MPLTTEMEEADGTIAEPVLEETNEQPPAPTPAPTAANQGVSALEPTDMPEPEPIPELEVTEYPASAG